MKIYQRFAIQLLLCALPGLALADAAGEIIFVSGSVVLAPDVPAQRGMPVNEGDEIVTGEDGRAQLLMQDGDRFAIRPNSRFLIRRFETRDQQQTPQGEQPDGQRVYELIEGGIRTLTDELWKRDKDNYEVKTPVATIGIRGTDYELFLEDLQAQSTGCGLYIAVNSGAVQASNSAASTTVSAGQFYCIRSEDDPGTRLMAPPELFSGAHQPASGTWLSAVQSGIDSEGGEHEGRRSPNQQSHQSDSSQSVLDPPPDPEIPILGDSGAGPVDLTSGDAPQVSYVAFAAGPLGTETGFSSAGLVLEDLVVRDAQDDLAAWPGLYPADGGSQAATYEQGSSNNVNQGFDPDTGLRWGRWSGGTATAGGENIDLSQRSLHWIASQEQAQPTVLPISGLAEYQLVGNTDPTDNNGNTGFMDGTSVMQADFTNQQISTDLGLSINGQQWQAQDSNGQFGPGGTFAGEFDSVEVNGGQCSPCNGDGGYSGFFTGGNGSGPPPGAGMGYGMQQGDTSVSGTAAFGNPTPVEP